MAFFVALLAGTATGVLSGYGLGGGTLLLLYMTSFTDLSQVAAQGINLLYFLPTAATALPSHIKNGYVKWPLAIPAILGGLLTTALAAWAATSLDTHLLRTCFGAFLLLIGITELFAKKR